MAELQRTNLSAPPVSLDTSEPAVSTNKTTKVLGQLATLGAKGMQLYEKEHEAKMANQAMNDMVNDAVSPELAKHEAAYARVVTHGKAMNDFNSLKNDIANGKYNEMSPEDFQKTMSENHAKVKEGMSGSKYSDHLASTYDKFWLENGATTTAGQAGMYRKNLEFKQTRQLRTTMSGIAKASTLPPEETAKLMIAEGGQGDYTMIDEGKIIDSAMMAGIDHGNAKLLEALDAQLGLSLDPVRSKPYSTALKFIQKSDRSVDMATAVQNRERFFAEAEAGTLTDEKINAYGSLFNEKGAPLFSSTEMAAAKRRTYTKRVNQQVMNTYNDKYSKNIDISDATSKMQKEISTDALAQDLNAPGANREQIFMKHGELAKNLNVPIPMVKQMVQQVGQFDFKDLASDAEADNFIRLYEDTKSFLNGFGGVNNAARSQYLGKFEARFDKLEEYMQGASGDDRTKIRNSAKLVDNWQRRLDARIPMQDTSDWNTNSDTDDYVDNKKGFSAHIKDFFGETKEDTELREMHGELTKKLGAEQGMTQEAASRKAGQMMDQTVSYLGGQAQPVGINALKVISGGDPETKRQQLFDNPTEAQLMDEELGPREFGELRDPDDYSIHFNPEGTWVTIVDKNDPNKSYGMSADSYRISSSYSESDGFELANMDALMDTDTPESRHWKNIAITDADYWYNTEAIDKAGDRIYAGENLYNADGTKVQGAATIPAMKDWVEMSEEDRIRYHQSWKNVNFGGSVSWTRKAWNIMRTSTIGTGIRTGASNVVTGVQDQVEREPNRSAAMVTPIDMAQKMKYNAEEVALGALKYIANQGGFFLSPEGDTP